MKPDLSGKKIAVMMQHALTRDQLNGLANSKIVINESVDNLIMKMGQVDPEHIPLLVEEVISFVKANDIDVVLIQGHPGLIVKAVTALKEIGVDSIYSHTVRNSVEKVGEDGTVVKTAIFSHDGFYYYL